ncbi:Cytoplasmic 60S subunit biogenesis factor REI1-like protein 2 [Colletotrichum chlorophyti]|uniref:Cytoplasmic 60S subunit biogenesis factor REI1-like protein 2 n=1 Tax=Colletotrichum chlorophyti TaxID=708187 RepID=A0A1Q8S996_9PEZI|nr:Cytoplasmic 60S subunit biogenesis factor REI1-like protein 2 [Colletotrichum chlorophyti]
MEGSSTSHFKLSAASCGTCAVHFQTPEIRRAHSKSQWHVTNLKRRIADLEPLTAEQHAALPEIGTPAAIPVGKTTTDAVTDESSSSGSDTEPDPEDFIPEDCLFCNTTSESLDDNIAHMHKAHGMFIPERERLIVDEETLMRYLHLVIFGYRECLQCGTQRRTPAAVQQHMLGKGHCRFDITAEDSEFRDFYENRTDDAGDQTHHDDTKKAIAEAVEEGGAIRLPSGKLLANRSAPAPPRPRGHNSASTETRRFLPGASAAESEASFQLAAPSTLDTEALTRAEKRDVVFETQLARLSINDRNALAHLPSAEQRSILLTQKNQADRVEKAARRLQTRLEMKANKTGQGHFVNDVPGRKNG